MPTESACCFPSATTVTTAFAGKAGVIMAPFEVSPGHIILAPERTKVIAPLSTCINGQMKGSIKWTKPTWEGKQATQKGNQPLTFMNESERGKVWPITLFEEKIITCRVDDYFNVVMTGIRRLNHIFATSQNKSKRPKGYHLTMRRVSFLGIISSMWFSKYGKCSTSLFLMPFWTLDLSWVTPETLESSNLKKWIS